MNDMDEGYFMMKGLIFIGTLLFNLVVGFFWLFHRYAVFIDMFLIWFATAFIASPLLYLILPKTLSGVLGIVLASVITISFWLVYKKQWGYWVIKIIATVLWSWLAFCFAKELFADSDTYVYYLSAFAFGIFSFISHKELSKSKGKVSIDQLTKNGEILEKTTISNNHLNEFDKLANKYQLVYHCFSDSDETACFYKQKDKIFIEQILSQIKTTV